MLQTKNVLTVPFQYLESNNMKHLVIGFVLFFSSTCYGQSSLIFDSANSFTKHRYRVDFSIDSHYFTEEYESPDTYFHYYEEEVDDLIRYGDNAVAWGLIYYLSETDTGPLQTIYTNMVHMFDIEISDGQFGGSGNHDSIVYSEYKYTLNSLDGPKTVNISVSLDSSYDSSLYNYCYVVLVKNDNIPIGSLAVSPFHDQEFEALDAFSASLDDGDTITIRKSCTLYGGSLGGTPGPDRVTSLSVIDIMMSIQ